MKSEIRMTLDEGTQLWTATLVSGEKVHRISRPRKWGVVLADQARDWAITLGFTGITVVWPRKEVA